MERNHPGSPGSNPPAGPPEVPTSERYAFVCKRCGHDWSWSYGVQRKGYPGGSLIETFYRDGRACSPPWSTPRCPACGALRVALRGREG